jgi:hypothetical protein
MVMALWVASWLGSASEVQGQTIRGRVLDTESGEPVALAYVGLLAPGRELVVATLADVDGDFSVRAPEDGSYFLYVARTGYQTLLDGLFELGDDGLFELEVGVRPAPLPIAPVAVDVPSTGRDLGAVGFYERRDLGLGHFLGREEIERVGVGDLTDAFIGIPGLRVVTPVTSLVVPTGVMNPEILVRRAAAYCSPTLFVDGAVVALGARSRRSRGTEVRPGDFVDPSDVEAVEIYTRPADTPPQFESASGCGVVLIWTRNR